MGNVMKVCWVVALTGVLSAASAPASGYDEFSQGVTANLRNDPDIAIAAFTQALQSGELVSEYVPLAYRGRAAAYLQKDMCTEALADFRTYTALKGSDSKVLSRRIWAELCIKDVKAARSDFEEIAGPHKRAADVWDFARMEWQFGLYAQAAEDAGLAFRNADKEELDKPYMLLWQALNADRAGQLDRHALATAVGTLDSDEWPRPLLDLYLGKLTPDEVKSSASSWRGGKAQKCEADFYVAQWYLARGSVGPAQLLLQAAVKDCPGIFLERDAATVELKRQGKGPAEE